MFSVIGRVESSLTEAAEAEERMFNKQGMKGNFLSMVKSIYSSHLTQW